MTLQEAKMLYNSNKVEFKNIALNYFTETELNSQTLPKSWEDLPNIQGYYISANSSIVSMIPQSKVSVENWSDRNVFADKKQAKSALAFAQLSQLIKVLNKGWEPDWENSSTLKHTIVCSFGKDLAVDYYYHTKCHLVFKTKELAEFSLKHHKELWEKFWMV